jgi:putative SOS response-associated peptidase YedK
MKTDEEFQINIQGLILKVLPRKMYREAALKRRCLVLGTDVFEWRHMFPTRIERNYSNMF